MKILAKCIRVASIAPSGAALLLTLLFFFVPQAYSAPWEYWFSLGVLAFLPLLAYPIQWIFQVFPGDGRSGERNLAILFSFAGYFAGLVVSLSIPFSAELKIVFLTYFLSGTAIAVMSFGFRVKASGHMCGVSGPIAIILLVGGWTYLPLLMVLVLVFWASTVLGRHTRKELLLGSLIPIIAMVGSIAIFK